MRRLIRTWTATTVFSLPLLALMLVPQLMRSRAGSQTLLLVGSGSLLLLVAAAVVVCPAFAARVSRREPDWTPRTAIAAAARAWRRRPGASIAALVLFVVVFSLAQLAGWGLSLALPYVSVTAGGGAVIAYPAYALQAIVVYLLTTLGLALYAGRMRAIVTAR